MLTRRKPVSGPRARDHPDNRDLCVAGAQALPCVPPIESKSRQVDHHRNHTKSPIRQHACRHGLEFKQTRTNEALTDVWLCRSDFSPYLSKENVDFADIFMSNEGLIVEETMETDKEAKVTATPEDDCEMEHHPKETRTGHDDPEKGGGAAAPEDPEKGGAAAAPSGTDDGSEFQDAMETDEKIVRKLREFVIEVHDIYEGPGMTEEDMNLFLAAIVANFDKAEAVWSFPDSRSTETIMLKIQYPDEWVQQTRASVTADWEKRATEKSVTVEELDIKAKRKIVYEWLRGKGRDGIEYKPASNIKQWANTFPKKHSMAERKRQDIINRFEGVVYLPAYGDLAQSKYTGPGLNMYTDPKSERTRVRAVKAKMPEPQPIITMGEDEEKAPPRPITLSWAEWPKWERTSVKDEAQSILKDQPSRDLVDKAAGGGFTADFRYKRYSDLDLDDIQYRISDILRGEGLSKEGSKLAVKLHYMQGNTTEWCSATSTVTRTQRAFPLKNVLQIEMLRPADSEIKGAFDRAATEFTKMLNMKSTKLADVTYGGTMGTHTASFTRNQLGRQNQARLGVAFVHTGLRATAGDLLAGLAKIAEDGPIGGVDVDIMVEPGTGQMIGTTFRMVLPTRALKIQILQHGIRIYGQLVVGATIAEKGGWASRNRPCPAFNEFAKLRITKDGGTEAISDDRIIAAATIKAADEAREVEITQLKERSREKADEKGKERTVKVSGAVIQAKFGRHDEAELGVTITHAMTHSLKNDKPSLHAPPHTCLQCKMTCDVTDAVCRREDSSDRQPVQARRDGRSFQCVHQGEDGTTCTARDRAGEWRNQHGAAGVHRGQGGGDPAAEGDAPVIQVPRDIHQDGLLQGPYLHSHLGQRHGCPEGLHGIHGTGPTQGGERKRNRKEDQAGNRRAADHGDGDGDGAVHRTGPSEPEHHQGQEAGQRRSEQGQGERKRQGQLRDSSTTAAAHFTHWLEERSSGGGGGRNRIGRNRTEEAANCGTGCRAQRTRHKHHRGTDNGGDDSTGGAGNAGSEGGHQRPDPGNWHHRLTEGGEEAADGQEEECRTREHGGRCRWCGLGYRRSPAMRRQKREAGKQGEGSPARRRQSERRQGGRGKPVGNVKSGRERASQPR